MLESINPETLVQGNGHLPDVTEKVKKLLSEQSGIRLDIGGGANPNPGFISMDIRDIPGKTGVLWDFNRHPWTLPDESVLQAVASHVLEHVPGCVIDNGRTRFPFIEFMDDCWRCLKVGGEFAVAVPHGNSPGFMQDPTHCNMMNETRWAYFDPEEPRTQGLLFNIYKPSPFRIKFLSWDPSANMEVVLVKRAWKDEYRQNILRPKGTVKYE